jgi:4-hydroxybenzoate polyprenyltransferase
MLGEYLKLSRLFNMGLTGVAPVLGALSMWNIGETSISMLFILFIIGCLSHIYGFVLNDVIDIKVDKLSKELTARPLVSGTITRKKAAYFAISCMILSWVFALFFYFYRDMNILSFLIILSILIFADILSTIYNFVSKKYPCMDIFVASAIFFLIIFGAATVSYKQLLSTPLVWIVALIGSIQVLFMNMINGAIKDIDHDVKGMANTLAIRLGAGVKKGIVTLPLSFKTIGYIIEASRSFLVFSPFIFLSNEFQLQIWQIALLIILTVLTFSSIYKLFSIKKFKRNMVRKYIGITVIFMYATTPVMLYSLNPYIILVALVPPLWFIFSNILLHKTTFAPKTM